MLQELKLWELSLATFPMNEQATIVAVKSLDQVKEIMRGVKPSEVDDEMLVCLRSIAGEVKRLLVPAGDSDTDTRKVKEHAEELEALKSLAAKIKDYLAA